MNIQERCIKTKQREKYILRFMQECTFFFKQNVYIEEGYELDIFKREVDGSVEAIGDIKCGSSAFCDIHSEMIHNQQEYYLLNYDQFLRYKKDVSYTDKDFMLYMFHFFTPEVIQKFNTRFKNFTKIDEPAIFLQEEVSVLCISIKRLIELESQNLCHRIKLSKKSSGRYVTPNSTGQILKVSSRSGGTYVNLTSQFNSLPLQRQRQLLG